MRFFLLTTLFISTLYSGDSFMESWNLFDLASFYATILTIILFPFAVFIKFVRPFILGFIAYIAIYIVWNVITAELDRRLYFHISNHYANPISYGKYEDKRVYQEENSSIIDLDIKMYTRPVRSYLTQNGYLACNINYENKTYYNIKRYNPIMASCEDFSSIKEIIDKNRNYLIIDIDTKTKKPTSAKREKLSKEKFIEFNNDHLDISNTPSLKVDSYRLLPIMFAKYKTIFFIDKDGIYPDAKIELKREPKLVAYSSSYDKFYIVYKDDDKKIYELENVVKGEFISVQNSVKSIINSAFAHWWGYIDMPNIKALKRADIEQIRELYKEHKDLDFYYKIKKDKNRVYTIDVYSNKNKTTALEFKMKYINNSLELISFKTKAKAKEKERLHYIAFGDVKISSKKETPQSKNIRKKAQNSKTHNLSKKANNPKIEKKSINYSISKDRSHTLSLYKKSFKKISNLKNFNPYDYLVYSVTYKCLERDKLYSNKIETPKVVLPKYKEIDNLANFLVNKRAACAMDDIYLDDMLSYNYKKRYLHKN